MFELASLINMFFNIELCTLTNQFFYNTPAFIRYLYHRSTGVVSMSKELQIIYNHFVRKGYFE
jgi:hypothetical protein